MFGVNKDRLCICQIVHIHCGDIIIKLSSAVQARNDELFYHQLSLSINFFILLSSISYWLKPHVLMVWIFWKPQPFRDDLTFGIEFNICKSLFESQLDYYNLDYAQNYYNQNNGLQYLECLGQLIMLIDYGWLK